MRTLIRAVAVAAVTGAALTGLAACGGSPQKASGAGDPVTLRLGYFPNLTHATPIVGIKKNFYADKLGRNVAIEAKTFNAGPEAVEALFSGAVDATYIGPNPTVNAWQKSKGQAVRVVAGAASGGAAFVVKPDITGPEQLKGKKIASPQLGNTQDVALRYWLKQHGLNTTKEGGGDITILPQANADTVTAFGTGAIDGAWVPEPFASRLVKAGGKVLVDERDLWPGGKFVVTNLLVSTKFLKAHPDVVKNLIAGQVEANDFINANPVEAQQVVNAAIGELSGKVPDAKQTADAWKTLTFLNDPIASSLRDGARHAEEVGLLQPVDLTGIYDLTLLNEVLKARGAPEVKV
ncbi:ABC transporter substrate-binding protein [Planosporangium flavigriseum]|uniref:Lipoprotein n=1 Tax=Planosporangium flavigriseum TaxID=373681 RepID=A0A8J3LNG2_9ACTN|nr:ABC transporter substrate-binding protein [Planosporangium flavigriseum]NJC63880.1 ABC transporter substrate-binding protein [Planosporangium flavigriseum]GIG74594.1 lipoprotein [Planosporangium flavigriseum]